MTDDTPIYDALIRHHAQVHRGLIDDISERWAAAFLTDDILAAVVTKWAGEEGS